MATITRLQQFLNGISRGVDLTSSSLIFADITVGGVGGTTLNQSILDHLIALQNGTDFSVATNSHTHNGLYYLQGQLSSQSVTSGASLIGVNFTPVNFTAAAKNIESYLSAIDTALVNSGTTVFKDGTFRIQNSANLTKIIALDASGISSTHTRTLKMADTNVDLANLTNTNISAFAHISVAKLAPLTPVTAVVTDGGGILIPSTVSAATLAFLDATSSVQTQLDNKLSLAGGTMQGALNMGSSQINFLTDPTSAQDAATKNYVDNLANGIAWKAPVRAVSTSQILLSGTQTIDGIVLSAGDRVLVNGQTTSSQNGIYLVAAGAWVRPSDASTGSQLVAAAFFVDEGVLNAVTSWVQQTPAPITVGTSALTFTKFSSATAAPSSGSGELTSITNPSGANGTTGWGVNNNGSVLEFLVENPGLQGLNPIIPTSFRVRQVSGAGSSVYFRFPMPVSLQQVKQKIQFYQAFMLGWKIDLYTNPLPDYSGAYTRIPLNSDVANVTNLTSFTGKFVTTFDATNDTFYEFRITHVGGGAARFTNVIIGPGIQPQGAVIGPPISFSPVGTWTTNTTYTGNYTRVGNKAFFSIIVTINGAVNATALSIAMPTGLTIDTGLVSTTAYRTSFGSGQATGAKSLQVISEGSAGFVTVVYQAALNADQTSVTDNTPKTWGVGDTISLTYNVPVAEWAGSGVVNLTQNDVEYASNSSTSVSASDITSFTSGQRGSLIGDITTALTRRVRYPSIIQNGDQFILQLAGPSGRWITVASRVLVEGTSNVCDYQDQAGVTYGIGRISTVNATDVDIYFGTYATDAGNAYGGAGSSWTAQGASAIYYRLVKCTAGQAVGFGQVTQFSSGLVKSAGQLLGTNTNDSALPGYVGETLSVTNPSLTTLSGSGISYTVATLTLTPGHWTLKAYGILSNTGQSAFLVGISFDPSPALFGDMASYDNPGAANWTQDLMTGASDSGIELIKTINLAATTTLYMKARLVGPGGSCGVYFEAIRIR